MARDKQTEQLLMQVSRAREALGNALGLVQDLESSEIDLSAVIERLALAVRSLFAAQENGLQDAEAVGQAMQYLRDILQMMQDVQADDSKINAATSTVARILAILFPVYKALSTPVPEKKTPSVQALAPETHQSTPADDHDERRGSPRKAIEADIGFQSESNFFTGFSTDISSGGLFVATYDMPAIGTSLNLNFRLPKGQMVSVDGEVRWTREFNEFTPDVPPGIGVKFSNLNQEDAKQINSYMESNQPLFFDES